ncbi:hypothetical protein BT96DRAFT_859655 [Gymnopus androsaceus JB14]|uniref:Uncharacterized protein n=1 Tax=Gymnopus androsaceus JB14 TaxID=1447944 RepID=A0A6A4HIE9_9AGAR|nr:hypothetical protein BT96DRAFT_859655 [Gymnopus androsaceus JB14]
MISDIHPTQSSSLLTLPSPLSEKEAGLYYFGLPSRPVLVARSSTTPWEAPTGPGAFCQPKELHPVGNHALQEVWEDNLALKLHALLEVMQVKWTSTDVVRIGNLGESEAPAILWIGVMPKSLSGDDGVVVASKCRDILVEYDITDIDVEIRESIVTRSAGPKLLTSTYSDDTADVRDPLTTNLGLPVGSQSTPCAEGTGGFFITEGGSPERLLLVTARHVVLPRGRKSENIHFQSKDNSAPPYNVMLFSDTSFRRYLESLEHKIDLHTSSIEILERRMRWLETDERANTTLRQEAQFMLDKLRRETEEHKTLYQDVLTHWATPESRVLGHVVLSPPIKRGAGTEGYTQDWAVIEIDASKINATNFNGNAIDLGNRFSAAVFSCMMRPDPQNELSFTYPYDRLLQLKDIIPEEEIRRPKLDQNGKPCLIVIKRGSTTGLTVGRANGVFSYTREYFQDGEPETSKEWAILQFDSKSGAFSAKGDSGAVVVDGLGRMGGLLTGASGGTGRDSLDITYATPISFILKSMEENGLRNPNIHPVLARR